MLYVQFFGFSYHCVAVCSHVIVLLYVIMSLCCCMSMNYGSEVEIEVSEVNCEL
jgi:hypothetical protein